MTPDKWVESPLNEVARVIDCKHRTPSYVDTGIPLISPGVIKWGPIDLNSPTKRVTLEEYKSLMDHCTIDIGDLILSRNQSVGVASYVCSNDPFVLGQDTVLVKPTKIENKFLFYSLQSSQVQRKIYKLAGGSTFSRINLGDIRKLIIEFPSQPEQKKISQILSTWDKAIETVEKLIENSQQKKKALMQQLLTGKKRFPGFDGERKDAHLSLLAEVIMGSSPPSNAYNDSGIGLPLIQGNADIKSRASAPRVFSSEITKECLVGDIILSVRAPVGEVAISMHHACIGRGVAAIRAKKGQSHSYLYQWLLWNEPKWQRVSQGSTFTAVNGRDVKVIRISMPVDVNEQQRIADALSASDTEISNQKTLLEAFKQEKKALMQQLLTGKRRVRIAKTSS